MRENMPGQGYAQGHVDLVDRGPSLARRNSFDQSYMKGRFPMWIRHQGETPGVEFDDPADHGVSRWRDATLGAGVRPVGYNRPRAEEPYVEALAEFFETRIALMPPKPRQDLGAVKDWLHSVMHDGRSTREIATDLGFADHTAVVKARKRAVDQLVESCGGKAVLAEKLRQFLHDKEQQDGLERLKYLPRWVHG